jgi:CBS domain-containing protein
MNPNTAIKEIMSNEIVTVRKEDTINTINKIFEKKTFHHLPVVDADYILVGIISKEDILRLISVRNAFSETQFEKIQVNDIMTSKIITLEPDDTIGLAADIFLANRFHALPITENNKLIGIVTTYDLIKFSFKDPFEKDNTVEPYWQNQ